MVYYRFYFLTADGLIKHAEDMPAVDDDAAAALAIELDHANHIEIWAQQRLVGTADPRSRRFWKGHSIASAAQRSDPGDVST